MRALAHRVILLWGWRRNAVAFAAGGLSALAQAPWHLAPILFLTIPTLVWLLDGAVAPGRRGIRRLRPAAMVGWFFGFGYFLAGLWWIGEAFLVDAAHDGWMMPFAVIAMPAGLALFHALGATIARLLWVESPLRVFSLALGLSAAEWLRGHVLTGFPWNMFGQVLDMTDATAQAASLIGVEGLTALVLLVAALPAIFADEPARRMLTRYMLVAMGLALVIGDVGYGFWRLSTAAPRGEAVVAGMRFRIVQPNVNQGQKWDADRRQKILDQLIDMSDRKTDPETLGAMSFTHIIWPETALPFFLTEEPAALARIAGLLPPGTSLITGAPRVEPDGTGRRYYNSAYLVDDNGAIQGAYDKVHLVPFGEYMPFQSTFDSLGLHSLFKGIGGFSPGTGPKLIDMGNGLKAGILICYEIIFPGAVTDPSNRPDFLINLTNDGWFGRSWGPWQHLDMARMRAIEEGLPVLRAANTGISASIDAYGRITEKSALGQEAVLDVQLPSERPITFYSGYGSRFLLLFALIAVNIIIIGRRKPV